jgi:hypothetical protein
VNADVKSGGMTAPAEVPEAARPFFYSLEAIPGYTAEEMLADLDPEEQAYRFELFGRDLFTKTILRSPDLCVFHETAPPGARVKPHRHGTSQLTFVLRGELVYGNQHVGPGMGYFTPDTLYSWTVGPEGAEWLEMHSGEPSLFTDRPAPERTDET